jgi:hypothetical protein
MQLSDLEIQLDIASGKARDGIKLWKKIKDELKISDRSGVLLFPVMVRDIAVVFLQHIEQLASSKGYTNVYVLTPDEWIIENATSFSPKVAAVKYLSEYESNCLLTYYSLIEFSNRFYVCAINEPEGRLGELLIENAIPMDEIVCAGVYRIYNHERFL